MCLITACPEGTDKSSKALEGFIRSGMLSNTDGSGFMYKRKGSDLIGVWKGFRSEEKIMEAIDELQLKKEDELIIHHRTCTHGHKIDENMHPFYLSNDKEMLNITKGNLEVPAVAHNGQFFRYGMNGSMYSDTWHFVDQFMSTPEFVDLLQRDNAKFQSFFKDIISTNRLAFLFPNRSMILIGGFEEEDGYFHSNGGYKRKVCDFGGQTRRNNNRYPTVPSVMSRHDNEHELEGMMSAQQRFLTENHTWDEKKKMWIPKKREVRLANPVTDGDHSSVIENIVNNIKRIQDKVKTSGIRLSSKDIKITADNYSHFILVPHTPYVEFGSIVIPKGKPFTLEDYRPEALINYIVSYDSSKIMEYINVEKFLPLCHIFVKKENVNEYYNSLNKLVIACSSPTADGHLVTNPSATMLKKITKKLNSNTHKDEFQFKEYGLFKASHLNYFLNSHKPVNDLKKVLKDKKQEENYELGIPSEENIIVPEDFGS